MLVQLDLARQMGFLLSAETFFALGDNASRLENHFRWAIIVELNKLFLVKKPFLWIQLLFAR